MIFYLRLLDTGSGDRTARFLLGGGPEPLASPRNWNLEIGAGPYYPNVDSEFLKVFGQPARETACQCERSTDSNLSQALQMINGPLVHSKVRDPNNRLRRLAAAGKSNADIVGELYLAALCRKPSEIELAAATKQVATLNANQEQLLAKTKEAAAHGKYEPFKTSSLFDSTAQHYEWLGQEPETLREQMTQ